MTPGRRRESIDLLRGVAMVVMALGVGFTQGIPIRDVAVAFLDYPPEFGVGLGATDVFWMAIVLTLYPACRWFAGVEARRQEWWLSYL